MIHKPFLVVAMSVLLISVAAADDPDKPAAGSDATFKALDRDADQRLSKTEIASDQMLTEHFSAVDVDSDGYITKAEYSAHMKDMSEAAKKEY